MENATAGGGSALLKQAEESEDETASRSRQPARLADVDPAAFAVELVVFDLAADDVRPTFREQRDGDTCGLAGLELGRLPARDAEAVRDRAGVGDGEGDRAARNRRA